LATRVTRAIGDAVAAFCPPLALRFAPLRLTALFLIAGRFAARFLIAGRFAEDFLDAAPRFAGRAFFPERFADAARRFPAVRLLALLPPDFLRDFLARAAMTLLLGVGVMVNA
jgi:hypothetical protein